MAHAVQVGSQDASVFFMGDLRAPRSGYHRSAYDQVEDHKKKKRIQERLQGFSLYCSDRDAESAFCGAAADAGQTTETLGRTHHGLVFHIDEGRAVLAAGVTMDTSAFIPFYLKRADQAQKSEECAIGAEVSAPEISVNQ